VVNFVNTVMYSKKKRHGFHGMVLRDIVSPGRQGPTLRVAPSWSGSRRKARRNRHLRREQSLALRVFLRDPDQDGGRRQPLAGQQNDISAQPNKSVIIREIRGVFVFSVSSASRSCASNMVIVITKCCTKHILARRRAPPGCGPQAR